MGKRKLVNTVQYSEKQFENLDSNKKEYSALAKAYRKGTTLKRKA
jgi:hypothetical protein